MRSACRVAEPYCQGVFFCHRRCPSVTEAEGGACFEGDYRALFAEYFAVERHQPAGIFEYVQYQSAGGGRDCGHALCLFVVLRPFKRRGHALVGKNAVGSRQFENCHFTAAEREAVAVPVGVFGEKGKSQPPIEVDCPPAALIAEDSHRRNVE